MTQAYGNNRRERKGERGYGEKEMDRGRKKVKETKFFHIISAFIQKLNIKFLSVQVNLLKIWYVEASITASINSLQSRMGGRKLKGN